MDNGHGMNNLNNFTDDSRPKRMAIDELLNALRSRDPEEAVLPAAMVYGLSDLRGENLAKLRKAWPELDIERRRNLVKSLNGLDEMNYDLDFTGLTYVAFDDEDAEVRSAACRLCWYDMSQSMFERLLRLGEDPVADVRAAAMSALGRFILAGELVEFDVEQAVRAQNLALRHFDNLEEDIEVRRRSLEALSHCGHARVPDMIREAFAHEDTLMKSSAIFAMGASADRRWSEDVQQSLDSEIPEVCFEAVRAAGELEIAESVPQLANLIYGDDEEIKMQAVWALGQIATPEARRVLTDLSAQAEAVDDDELLEAIEEAMDMLMLMSGQLFNMFDFDEDFEGIDDDLVDSDYGTYLN
jgi:HEAT repeat protein